ncbi:MAG TPA: TerB family tellurite resistance protein [Polyangiaceae bacterium LLY-WYZ-14_1]|nr:TerB family tellurite resistance protein [Polyangiaceae bacterium LLY-WYZ-14_1]
MLEQLDRNDRLRLMKFVCSFAWADLQVDEAERGFVGRLIEQLDLDEEERQQVAEWLEVPPRPEELDPSEIPRSHRELFLEAVRDVIEVDGRIADSEVENFDLLAQLISD